MSTRFSIYRAAMAVWLVFLVVAFLFGTLREIVVAPLTGETAAHIIGTLAVIAAFLGIELVFVRRMNNRGCAVDFWLVGLLWFSMTAAFEFLFFHYVAGVPWDALLEDFNLAAGRIWVLVLVATAFGPPLLYYLLQHRDAGHAKR